MIVEIHVRYECTTCGADIGAQRVPLAEPSRWLTCSTCNTFRAQARRTHVTMMTWASMAGGGWYAEYTNKPWLGPRQRPNPSVSLRA